MRRSATDLATVPESFSPLASLMAEDGCHALYAIAHPSFPVGSSAFEVLHATRFGANYGLRTSLLVD